MSTGRRVSLSRRKADELLLDRRHQTLFEVYTDQSTHTKLLPSYGTQ